MVDVFWLVMNVMAVTVVFFLIAIKRCFLELLNYLQMTLPSLDKACEVVVYSFLRGICTTFILANLVRLAVFCGIVKFFNPLNLACPVIRIVDKDHDLVSFRRKICSHLVFTEYVSFVDLSVMTITGIKFFNKFLIVPNSNRWAMN